MSLSNKILIRKKKSKFHFSEKKVSFFFMMSLSFVKTLNPSGIRMILQNHILNTSALLEVWLQFDLNIGQQILEYILPFFLSFFPQTGQPQLEYL